MSPEEHALIKSKAERYEACMAGVAYAKTNIDALDRLDLYIELGHPKGENYCIDPPTEIEAKIRDLLRKHYEQQHTNLLGEMEAM